MKNFFRGLLTAFVGFVMIAALVCGAAVLVGVWFLDGYAAVGAFVGALSILGVDGFILYQVGSGGKYEKGNV